MQNIFLNFKWSLNENMISLAEKHRPISIQGKEWENASIWMDKNYIFKYKDIYIKFIEKNNNHCKIDWIKFNK